MGSLKPNVLCPKRITMRLLYHLQLGVMLGLAVFCGVLPRARFPLASGPGLSAL